MKLIIAIVQDEDASRLVSALMNDGYGVTQAGHHRRLPAGGQHHAAGWRGRQPL